jgi:hypothetical protein
MEANCTGALEFLNEAALDEAAFEVVAALEAIAQHDGVEDCAWRLTLAVMATATERETMRFITKRKIVKRKG